MDFVPLIVDLFGFNKRCSQSEAESIDFTSCGGKARIPQEDFLASLRAPTTSGYEKTISATTQEEVIAGKDGRLSKSIMDNTRSMEEFGIKINVLDIKRLELPE